jgi:hypothetical protein
MIYRSVVRAANGLTDLVLAERKRVSEQIVRDAQRLESLVFDGYDSYLEGDEPPGL